MQPMPPRPKPPYHERVRRITAYSLLANILFLVAIAASGALAPYVALHAIGGPRLSSLLLPSLPSFAAPLVSGLAADVAASRDRSARAVVAEAAVPAGDASLRDARTVPAERATPIPASVGPAAPATQSPSGGGIAPVGGGETTVSPVTPPADDPPPARDPVVKERPAKSKGHAYGVGKHTPKPKKSSAVKKKAGAAKKTSVAKKSSNAKTPKVAKPASTKKPVARSKH